MGERRADARVAYRRNVDVFCVSRASSRRCQISNLSIGGMFACGVGWMPPGESLRVTLNPLDRVALVLNARVVHHGADGVGIAFEHAHAERQMLLGDMLTPKWNGDSLLDAVVSMAPWYRQTDLVGWMRLTSLVADWQRLTQIARK